MSYNRYMMYGGQDEESGVYAALNTCMKSSTWSTFYLVLIALVIIGTIAYSPDNLNLLSTTFTDTLIFWSHIALIIFTGFVVARGMLPEFIGILLLILSFMWTELVVIKQTDPSYDCPRPTFAPTTMAPTTLAPTAAATVPGSTPGTGVIAGLGQVGSGVASGIGSGVSAIGSGLSALAENTEIYAWGRTRRQFNYLLVMTVINVFALVAGLSAYQCNPPSA